LNGTCGDALLELTRVAGMIDITEKMKMYDLPPPRVVAVDVDGTLYCHGEINWDLVEFCRVQKRDGYLIMLWSLRGEAHARRIVEEFEIDGVFDLICSKPGYLIDDQGWGWIKYTCTIPPDEAIVKPCTRPRRSR
jgi:hydroxymethylpyrimidine pyrophosphatase-like HAD family hydrolase